MKTAKAFFIIILAISLLFGCQGEDIPFSEGNKTGEEGVGTENLPTTDDITGEAPKTAVPATEEVTRETEEPSAPEIDKDVIAAVSTYDLIISDPDTNAPVYMRNGTNLGELCADAFRNATGSDISFVFAFELKGNIPAGSIRGKDIMNAFEQNVPLMTTEATGKEILDCLELAYSLLPEDHPYYIHPSGITFSVDMNMIPTVPITEGRIKDVRVNGEEISEEKVYSLSFSQSIPEEFLDIMANSTVTPLEGAYTHIAILSYMSDALGSDLKEEYSDLFGKAAKVIPLGREEAVDTDRRLPQIFITAEASIKRSSYSDCLITIHDPTGAYGDIFDEGASIKVRGHSTSSGKKEPYNFKFSEKQELLGLGKSKKWCLLANLYDKTQLRNMLALDFADGIGLHYVSRSRFAEVYLNGEYCGLYQLCEPVDTGSSGVDIDTKKNEFLLELEPYAGYENPYYITAPKTGLILGFNDPEPPTSEQRSWLKSFLINAENALVSNDYEKVKEYFDVVSFAKSYIVQELFKNVDYFTSSTRFYVKDGKLYEGPVWDFDLSSGNCRSSVYPLYNNADGSGLSYEGIYCMSLFNKYLFKYDEFKALVSDIYKDMRPLIINLYSENELGRSVIDRIVEEHISEIERNNELWSTRTTFSSYEHRPVDGTYSGEIGYLKDWLKARDEWLFEYHCSK